MGDNSSDSSDSSGPPREIILCNWAQYDDEYGSWETNCGQAFVLDEGTPSENTMKFCCYCGRPLTETPYVEDNDNG